MRLYRILSAPDDSTFCHKVTAALNKGWHLYGSPTYAYDKKTKSMRCGQSVVKDITQNLAVAPAKVFARSLSKIAYSTMSMSGFVVGRTLPASA